MTKYVHHNEIMSKLYVVFNYDSYFPLATARKQRSMYGVKFLENDLNRQCFEMFDAQSMKLGTQESL